jgi:tRNA G18 (ribose-2'-O)-methylase SpoU
VSRLQVDDAGDAERSEVLAGGRQPVVLVASLVDKVPNLAGLARTCEVFRASSLVLADRRAMKDPSFLNISVSVNPVSPKVLFSDQQRRL